MPSHDRSIDVATVAFEEGLRALLDAYYDELRAALTAWGVARELEEPAKRLFAIARLHTAAEFPKVHAEATSDLRLPIWSEIEEAIPGR